MDPTIRAFEAHGYAVLPDALAADDVAALAAAVDEEQRSRPELWIPRSAKRSDNYYALLANPVFDRTIVNARILPAVRGLMHGPACFDEFLLIVRSPCGNQRPATPVFHRDTSHLREHPLALRHLSVLYYLTDHDATTHCWSVVPEDVERKRQNPDDTTGAGAHAIYGKAGTAILFNPASCHAFVRRSSAPESRTIRVDFGHASRASIGNDTIVPARLLQSRPRSARTLFSRTNLITRLAGSDRP
jgi:ectoine hydroxylase-related dioxygenase (phytanoyl-CoA dioxygenase family)